MKYSYPYFSDEWVAVSFAQYSLESGKLPLVNPLWYDVDFPNFELPFHSFVSEILLLLNLSPLTHYTILAIFSGIVICLLVYFILRINHIDKLISALASLSVLYIVNGANLPGMWTLIPLTLGLISILLGFFFMSANKKNMVLVLAFLTLIFYPPLFVLYTFSLICYFVFADISRKEKVKYIISYFLISFTVLIILTFFAYFQLETFDNFVSYTLSKIFYESFTKNSIPDFSIWKILSIPILFLAILGLKESKKRSWLLAPVFVGLAYWVLYSRVLWRFVIEYERVVFATSVFITLLAGFGLNYLTFYLRKIPFVRKYWIAKLFFILILALFFVFSFSYTERDDWAELKLHVIGGKVISPAAPANIYLHEDDLKLFDFKEKRFLSVPWKGLVIGVATKNYPLNSKSSTITNSIFRYYDFMSADCRDKKKIAEDYEIDYIYSDEFECEGFEKLGKSEEELYLYKTNFLRNEQHLF